MTRIGQHRIRYDEETGELEREGTYTPKGTRIVAGDGDILVAKIAGTHVYGGQGRPQGYSGAHFQVYFIEREEDDGWLLVDVTRIRWPVRA